MMQTLKRICAVLCVMMMVGVGCSDSSSDDTSENSGADTDMTAEADTGTGVADTNTEADSGETDTGTDSPDTMADAPDEEGPSTWPLDEDGPYRVGFRSWEVTYSSPADGSDRTVVLNLWYPTEATTGEPAIYLGVFAFTDEEVLTDAPPAPPVHEGGYPVVVHSHGHLGFGGVSADLMRHMASHGWVAAAPDHTDNTLSDGQEPKPTSIFIHRPTDISAVLDTLEGLPSEDPLAGQMQTDKALLTGHSFGVYTIWSSGGAALDVEGLRSVCGPGTETEPFSNWEASCTEQELEAFEGGLGDERLVGLVPMAGSYDELFFGDTGWQNVDLPILYMSGSMDNPGRMQEDFEAFTDDAIWVNLEGGVHESFGLCGTLDPMGLGMCSSLDPQLGYTLVNTYVLAFARRHVLDDQTMMVESILSGETVPENVTFNAR